MSTSKSIKSANSILSINSRLAGYFRHHVTAEISMTPVPTRHSEVAHLYRSFKTLGNLEYFRINRDRSRFGLYDNKLVVSFNPSLYVSPLSPDGGAFVNQPVNEVAENQRMLIDVLQRTLALPRFSYLEHEWHLELQLKYKLATRGLRFHNKYELSPASSLSPFIRVSTSEVSYDDLSAFRLHIRHNFQKFHKFDYMKLSTGVKAINDIIGYEKLPLEDEV